MGWTIDPFLAERFKRTGALLFENQCKAPWLDCLTGRTYEKERCHFEKHLLELSYTSLEPPFSDCQAVRPDKEKGHEPIFAKTRLLLFEKPPNFLCSVCRRDLCSRHEQQFDTGHSHRGREPGIHTELVGGAPAPRSPRSSKEKVSCPVGKDPLFLTPCIKVLAAVSV